MAREDDREREGEGGGGFRVTDRRRFDAEGNVKDEGADRASMPPAGAPAPAPSAPAPSDPGAPSRGASPSDETLGQPERSSGADRIGFSELIMSVATTALAYLGHQPGDSSRVPGQVNLRMAAQNIDIIAMLRDKTRGNLTDSESELVESVLNDLRLLYVQTAGQVGPSGPSGPA